MSSLLGLDIEINSTGGNAFNFINYVATLGLFIVLFTKVFSIPLRWKSAWPIYLLILTYCFNALLAPYVNPIWVGYQIIFLTIALVLHLFVQKVDNLFYLKFRKTVEILFWLCMVLVGFCLFQIITTNSIQYYLAEFNEVFVHTLDDYGIMKQHFGYLLGFLLCYTLFIVPSRLVQVLCLILILSIGLGIRSFILGLVGVMFIYWLKRPRMILPVIFTAVFIGWIITQYYLDNLIFDTRFYSFLNAFDIIQNYPFGLGLGGYPVYTETFGRELFANLFNINAVLDFVPTAPESDLVHLFGSLGLTGGIIHVLVISRIIWWGFRLQDGMNKFEKCILFYFCFMTFFGISEDSIFSVNYWIFFGLASGVIAKHLYFRKRIMKNA